MRASADSLFRLRRPLSLRSHLIILIFTVVLPVVLFSGWVVLLFDSQQRKTFEKGATERTLAISTAVDAELRSSIATLEALAASENLDVDNFGRFYNEAIRVQKSQPGWFTLSLASPQGEQFFNLTTQIGADLPSLAREQSFLQVLRTRKPVVGGLTVAPTKERFAFTVSVPVVRRNAVKYVLTAVINPQSIDALVSAQKLPPDWTGAVLDGSSRLVSRTVDPEKFMGQFESDNIRAAIQRDSQGWFQATSLERRKVYTAYTRSGFSGWTVALTIPAAAVDASFREAIWSVGMLGFFLLILALAGGCIVSSKLISSIRCLRRMAQELGSGKQPDSSCPGRENDFPSAVSEFCELRRAFSDAHGLIINRSQQRDRVEAALSGVSERLAR